MKYNWVDAVILIAIIRGIYVGYKSGLSQEFFRFLALISAYYSALVFHPKVAQFITAHSLIQEKWALIISFVGIASLFFVLVILFFRIMQRWVKLEFVNNLNTYGGALAGGLRGFIVVSLILFAVFFVPNSFVKKQIYENSFLGHYAIEYTPKIYSVISKKLSSIDISGDKIRSKFEREKRKMAEAIKGDSGLRKEETASSKGDGIDDVQDEDSGQAVENPVPPEAVKDEELVNRGSEK